MAYRIEKDGLGEKTIPLEAYYGIGSVRSKEAFQITKHVLSRQMIKSLALTKKVLVKTNCDYGFIDKKLCEAILLSCDEILNGRLHGQFITDILQDGYGFGMEVNACEVICNRSNEMLGSKKGQYDIVKINDLKVNQDIYEVILLASKLTIVKLAKKLVSEMKKTYNTIKTKVNNSNSIAIVQLKSVSEILERDTKRLDKTINDMGSISYGAKVNLDEARKGAYLKDFISYLNKQVTEKYHISENYYTTSSNLDCFMNVSAAVKNLMINFSRCASDLKQLSKDKIIDFPNIQDVEVSSGDILFDFVKQVSFYIVGNDLTVSRTIEAGVLNENPYMPIVVASLSESINLVRRTIRTIKEKVFEIMTLN